MKRTYLTLIIVMLVIGFAAVTTNLVINGTINFGFNNDDFTSNVVFTYANAYNGTAAIDESTEKTINFTSDKLEDVDQKAILRYDVANKSNQYDASVTITCGFGEGSESYKDWLDIKNDLESSFTLEAGKTKTGNLTVTLTKAYNENLEDDVNVKCTIDASPAGREEKQEYVPVEHEYEEVLLQGADPVLEAKPVQTIALASVTNDKKLIPVKISNTGEVTKADTTEKWYDYENKEWANAVILADGVEEPEAGVVIPEANIESYFVWIPKFKYKIFDMGDYSSIEPEDTPYQENSQPIEIEFGVDNTENTATECKTPETSKDNGSCEVGKWMTHPAFTSFGDIKGIWVGKFETGYNQNDATTNVVLDATWNKEGAEKGESDPSKVIIKPNVYSWRNITTKNAFDTSYNYQRTLESHMMKNTEWGAVTYLTNSKYGSCTSDSCSEVRLNNNENLITGYSSITEPTTGWPTYEFVDIGQEKTEPKADGTKTINYLNTDSVKSSSNQNYTGIYDMSGGAWENVMGFIDDEELTKVVDKKYYDLYIESDTDTNYNNRILGDATGEMGPFIKVTYAGKTTSQDRYIGWNKDSSFFVKNDGKYFQRGGRFGDGTLAGLASFLYLTKTDSIYNSFRIVLAPE